MIAACPKCQTRYRLRLEQIGERGVRLRCRRCEALFRVLPPTPEEAQPGRLADPPLPPVDAAGPKSEHAPPAGTDSERVEPKRVESEPERPVQHSAPQRSLEAPPSPALVVAHHDAREAKRIAEVFSAAGHPAIASDDGVQALLSIHRDPPRIAILDTALSGVSGDRICELMKRNPVLREIPVVLLHDPREETQDPAGEGFGADRYIDRSQGAGVVEEALREPLRALGLEIPRPAPASPAAGAGPSSPVAPLGAGPSSPAPAPESPAPTLAQDLAPSENAAATPELAEELARAERLARIAVSDIILYNEEKFSAALQSSDPLATMRDEVEEGRSLLRGRIADEVFSQRDFVGDELLRVARERA